MPQEFNTPSEDFSNEEESAVESFLSAGEEQEIVHAIRMAEKKTSGEIRVHLEKNIKGDIYQYAQKIFSTLNMHKTQDRNGVLFLIGVESHNFAIYGDKGIHARVGNDFWQNIKKVLEVHFKKRKFKEGLVQAILESGEQLKTYFPYEKDDINELPDEISKGK